MSEAEAMFDLHKVARLLDIAERTVWRRVAEGALRQPVKVGRAVRWFESDVAEYQEHLRKQRDGDNRRNQR